MKIQWNRSEDGYVESKCGMWKITPLYWGCVRPQNYQLWLGSKKCGGFHETQTEAKKAAERYR